jgi:alpha-L-rhamnosidase
MRKFGLLGALCGLLLVMAAVAGAQQAGAGPRGLRVDELVTPLGIDDAAPRFSWQLQDSASGARQSAYEVQVASQEELLASGKADVWQSGRVESSQSLNVRYAGPALQPSTRYFWQVKVWDAAGKPYPVSAASWWETGLFQQENWRGQWIGFETPEEDAVRHAPAVWITSSEPGSLTAGNTDEEHIAYRQTITLTKPVRSAALFAAGQDTVSAWVNGAQLLKANIFPPWKQMPWKKFVRADATGALTSGSNTIAIETVHYLANHDGRLTGDAPPMIATLVVEYADGSVASFVSGSDWKAATRATEGWQQKGFDDAGWKSAVAWKQSPGPRSAPLGHPWIPDSVKALGCGYDVAKTVKSARIYATALGAYELYIDKKRVSNEVLSPGWTDYREDVKYQSYNVTALLHHGRNGITVLLAPGWYETPLEWFQQPNNYGDTPPALKAQMRIEYTDGSVQWVATDTSWKAMPSYILHSEIYDGESQDLRKDEPLWGADDSNESALKNAIAIEPKPVRIDAQEFQPIRVEQTLTAKTVSEPKPGIYVYDFGQNFAGVERLRVSGPAGTDVRVRFAEIVNADGTIYTENLRTAKATDRFILVGSGTQELMPHFTFHGFRYLEITGLPAAPPIENVTATVFHTDAPFTARLTTGSPMINQLWKNIQWGQRSNFVGIPTDCPQRDERLGWMGDAEVFWRAASYNADLAAFSRKFAADMRGTQVGTPFYGIYSPGTVAPNAGFAAGWSDAGVIIPWTSWLQSGDTSIIDQNWAAMEKYLDAINAANPNGLWKNTSGIPFADWLSPEGRTDYVLVASAYWAYDATLMRQMAHATGRTADEEKYARLFQKISAAFQKQFVHEDGFVAGADNSPSPFGQINNPNAKSHGGDTQTGYVLALHMNLVPEELRSAVAQKLANKIEANHGLLGTGFLGTPYLLEELTRTGHADLAYKLLLNTEYPSWGYLVGHGATTMWERWNGDQMKGDPSMNSYNHYAYGAVADWLYRYAAGVDASPLDAGFHTVLLHPVFDARLGSVSLDYDSPYGKIHSDWKITGSTAVWHLTLPANTTGKLALTAEEASRYRLKHEAQVIQINAGTSEFTVDLQ